MQCLARNKTPFYFALYKGTEEVIDENGSRTGEKLTTYYEPVSQMGLISLAKTNDNIDIFGVDADYDKTITLDNPKLPINEKTLIFIDEVPNWDKTNYSISNREYIITKISRSLNVLVLAIKKVGSNR